MDESFIRNRITELRMSANKSEREMSLDLGHSPSYINGITSGRISPSIRELLYICEYLGVTADVFFSEDSDYTPEISKCVSLIKQLSDEDQKLVIGILERLNTKQ